MDTDCFYTWYSDSPEKIVSGSSSRLIPNNTGKSLDDNQSLSDSLENSQNFLKGGSTMAKFHSLCQHLLETSSFLDFEDTDERLSPLDSPVNDNLLDDLEKSSNNNNFVSSLTITPELMHTQENLRGLPDTHSSPKPWPQFNLSDPEGLLQNVPIFFDQLLLSITSQLYEDSFHSQEKMVRFSTDSQINSCPELPLQDDSTNQRESDIHSEDGDAYTCARDETGEIQTRETTVKITEIPMDLGFVYTSSESGKLVPVKDFIRILESCCLDAKEKKEVVSKQYVIAREKCCLDWIEAIRNRGKKILPRWWLQRNLSVEGLESNKCRKRREWLEKKQAMILEEQMLREKKDLIFLGTKPDINIYIETPTGPESLLLSYTDDGYPTFNVEDYFASISLEGSTKSFSNYEYADLSPGLSSKWQPFSHANYIDEGFVP